MGTINFKAITFVNYYFQCALKIYLLSFFCEISFPAHISVISDKGNGYFFFTFIIWLLAKLVFYDAQFYYPFCGAYISHKGFYVYALYIKQWLIR